ncbi:MAG TPA: hypothetical protein PKD45_05930 [Flavobacteriales bacterium]|nr:hypothetical protein [Flavobacteriales bacterium]
MDSIQTARNIIKCTEQFVSAGKPKEPHIPVTYMTKIVELAFLGVMAAWEEFLENTMTRYLIGARTKTGKGPKLKIGHAIALDEAIAIVGLNPEYDPKRHIITWTSTTTIKARAKFFFVGGEPYVTALENNEALIQWAVAIRNRIAHKSKKCKAAFKDAALNFIKGPNLPSSYSPGKLLRSTATKNFSKEINQADITVFEAFMKTFEGMAEKIVP